MGGYPWFSFNGTRSDSFPGLLVTTLPVLSSVEARADEFTVPGRDGHLTVLDGGNSGFDVRVECRMLDITQREAIFTWLRGSGDLISSEYPTRRLKARVSVRMDPIAVQRGRKSFVATFRCQPYLFDASPGTQTLMATGSITNPGSVASLPLLKVYGAGVLTIGGVAVTITATGGETYIMIDCDAQECYYGTNNRNSKVAGGFQSIPTGTSTVTLGTGITQVDITGNWRYN